MIQRSYWSVLFTYGSDKTRYVLKILRIILCTTAICETCLPCFALLCLLTCLAKFLNLIGNDIVNKGHEELDCFFRVVEFVTCGTSGLRFLRRKAVLKRFFLVWGRVKHPTPVPTPPPSPFSISAALFRPVYAPSREETAERVSGKACLKSVERFDNFCSF